MNWLAIDVGGANLKVSDGGEYAWARHFALWKHPHELADRVRSALVQAPEWDALAVTMTGELADCFASKSEGVRFILRAVTEAAGGRDVRVYLVDGRMVAPSAAFAEPLLAAAANWHALAVFAGRYARSGAAILLDIGSTTCDIVPLVDGRPAARGRNDTARLLAGELVYTGVERTPVCAVIDRAPYRGHRCPIVPELFATTRDAYIVLGELEEEPDDCDTADGRPAVRAACCDRLARMICADSTSFDARDAAAMACAIADAQAARIETALSQVISRMPAPPGAVILSGHGDFLGRRALAEAGLDVAMLSLAERLGPAAARVATAHALAVLAREGSEV